VNNSINEVLSRTIITSLTVVLVLVPLVLFGGEVLHDFSLALLFGVIVGTYSSVFVASPILVVWQAKTGGSLIRKR
jgi:preprotein translocase subunit SecF